ncbi:MAG: Tll0287-like domain-containing protein [Luteibaculaceae bacterium]
MRKQVFGFLLVSSILFAYSCGGNIQSETEVLHKTPQNSSITKEKLLHIGDSLTTLAFKTLSKNLQEKMEEGAPLEAIEFCQTHALDLTHVDYPNLTIKRAAIRNRNYKNAADSLELEVKDLYAAALLNGKDIKPVTLFGNAEAHYFKPILMMPLCLQCHGSPGDEIAPETLRKINDLYPNDKAIGFKAGDLRGIWHLTLAL